MVNKENFDYFIYARKSKYIEESESIENQVKMCTEYILSRMPGSKEENIKVYKDEDVSAKDTNRRYFKEMIADYKIFKPHFVVCYRLDRISRSVNDFSTLIHELDSKGIQFVSIKEQFDTSTPMGRAMMYISAVFAQMERETIAERVKDSMMYLAAKGRKLGKTPTGFDSYEEKSEITDGRFKSSHYLKENEDSEIIKIIFKKFVEFGSLHIVTEYLSKNEIKTSKGKYFLGPTIEGILKNPTYCVADKSSFEYFKSKGSDICFDKNDFNKGFGIAPFNRNDSSTKLSKPKSKWIIAMGKHPGIIPSKDWISVQNILDRKISMPRAAAKSSLLSGLIICENCGSSMSCRRESRPDRKQTYYYVCSIKYALRKSKCTIKNINGPKIEEFIIDYIMNFDEKKLKKDLNIKKFTGRANKFDDKIDEAKYFIRELEKEKDKYILYLKELTPASPLLKDIELKVLTINNKIDRFKEQIQFYEAQLNAVSGEKADVERILKNLQNFKQNFHTLDFEHKKALLRLVVDKLTWNGSDLKIFLNGEKS